MDEIDTLLESSDDGVSKLQFVDEDFKLLAQEAYATIGMPNITLTTAWTVFKQIVE